MRIIQLAALIFAFATTTTAVMHAQEPPPVPGSPVAPTVTAEPPTPVSIPLGSSQIRATLVVEAPGSVPDGTRIRIRSDSGTCRELPIPTNAVAAVANGGRTELPEIVIPPAAQQPHCGTEGETIVVELVFPNGSTLAVLTGPFTPGVITAEFLVRQGIPQPGSGPETIAGDAQIQLPSTGTGNASGFSFDTTAAVILVPLGALATLAWLRRRSGVGPHQ